MRYNSTVTFIEVVFGIRVSLERFDKIMSPSYTEHASLKLKIKQHVHVWALLGKAVCKVRIEDQKLNLNPNLDTSRNQERIKDSTKHHTQNKLEIHDE